MLHILGMGHDQASTVIDNKFLEDLDIGTNAEWIMDKIGIETRVSTLPLDYIKQTRNQDPREGRLVASKTSTDLAVNAARMAITNSRIDAKDIGMVLMDCCTPDRTGPAESSRVCEQLGITARAFDVYTACPAFSLHMDFLRNFNPDKLPDYILCVSATAMTQHVNYNDRSDGAIWGDGSAAWIVSPRHPGKLACVDTEFQADPTRASAVVIETAGHFWQDGRAVRDFSVRQTVRLIKQMEERHPIDWSRDIFVGHQANATMLRQITDNRSIPQTNHWHNVTFIGNQAGAGAPASLAMHWDKIVPGQKIVVAVVGAGLSWGSVLLEAQ